jgi:hypothetical protein
MVTLRLADNQSSNTMMRSTSDCRMIADEATTSSMLNGKRFRSMGWDIEDDYAVCRSALDRLNSKKVAL